MAKLKDVYTVHREKTQYVVKRNNKEVLHRYNIIQELPTWAVDRANAQAEILAEIDSAARHNAKLKKNKGK